MVVRHNRWQTNHRGRTNQHRTKDMKTSTYKHQVKDAVISRHIEILEGLNEKLWVLVNCSIYYDYMDNLWVSEIKYYS